jgi:hypothetical protein
MVYVIEHAEVYGAEMPRCFIPVRIYPSHLSIVMYGFFLWFHPLLVSLQKYDTSQHSISWS